MIFGISLIKIRFCSYYLWSYLCSSLGDYFLAERVHYLLRLGRQRLAFDFAVSFVILERRLCLI
jgi:hypothetical protein